MYKITRSNVLTFLTKSKYLELSKPLDVGITDILLCVYALVFLQPNICVACCHFGMPTIIYFSIVFSSLSNKDNHINNKVY